MEVTIQYLPVVDKYFLLRQHHLSSLSYNCNLFSSRTVPTGVSKVFINAYGAKGGRVDWGGTKTGGYGGWVQAYLSVTAGQTLYINVGGDGFTGSSYNGGGRSEEGFGGGGGGGGATDIQTISGNLTSRLIVAGGGGGSIYDTPGGNGGTKTILRSLFFVTAIFCLRN